MSVPGPSPGPCSPWITGDDVAACCDEASNAALYDDVALEASWLLFQLSGRLYPGLCEATVRPCADRCGCWLGARAWGYGWDGLRWSNECGDACGCGTLSQVKLAGYPVREVSEVKVDGDVVPADEYRLDRWRYLVRLADPGPPVVSRRWPSCQNLALEDDQPGTFSVTYSWGSDPPLAGISAAAELACQLYSACGGESDCALPANATRIIRQGVEIDRRILLDFLGGGSTGMVLVDAFLAGQGFRGRRRPAVWTPDVTPFPRRVIGT